MRFFLHFFIAFGVSAYMDILVPSYFESDSDWSQMTTACSQVLITAIINPSTGPGVFGKVADYQPKVDRHRRAGGKVLGYVHSSLGDRDLNLLKSEIDQYHAWYSLDGFFIDEMEPYGKKIGYYKDLYKYIKGKNGRYIVVQNPGMDFNEDYATNQTGDRFVCRETQESNYATAPPLSWNDPRKYHSSMFINLVHTATEYGMRRDVDLALRNNVGGIYVTERTMLNPWDGLADFWDQEVAYVKMQ